MNRGVGRADVFAGDRDRHLFEGLLARVSCDQQVQVHAYCLMGNHYHLLLHCPHGRLSEAMQQLGSSFTRAVNHRLGRDGPLFRGRFHSVVVGDARQLVRTAAYIHRNPIDLVPSRALAAYRWSSFGPYLGARPAPPWLVRSAIDSVLDRETHRALVLDAPPQPADAGPGSGRSRVSAGGASLDRIQAAVDAALAEVGSPEAGGAPGAAPPHIRRALRLVIAAGAGRSAAELAADLHLPSSGAARTALARARRTVGGDPRLALVVDRAVADLDV